MSLFRVLDFPSLLYDEGFQAGKFFLRSGGKITRPVLEQHDEGECQNDEQDEPEKTA